MRIKDIVIGKTYRLKSSPSYGYLKALEIIPPRQHIKHNNFVVIKCEHTVNKNDTIGFIRYFRPINIAQCE
jgi:hypothetical protein